MRPIPYTTDLFVNDAGEFLKKTPDGYEDVPIYRSNSGHPTVNIERFNWGHRKPCHAGELALLAYGRMPPPVGAYTVSYLDGNFLNLAQSNISWRSNSALVKKAGQNRYFLRRLMPAVLEEEEVA